MESAGNEQGDIAMTTLESLGRKVARLDRECEIYLNRLQEAHIEMQALVCAADELIQNPGYESIKNRLKDLIAAYDAKYPNRKDPWP
jgi:hypothetical protein